MPTVYRCGWCGNPCDKDGKCLPRFDLDSIPDADWDKAEPVAGECCPHGGYERQDRLRSEWEAEMRRDAFGELLEGE